MVSINVLLMGSMYVCMHVFVCLCIILYSTGKIRVCGSVQYNVPGGVSPPPTLQDFVILFPLLGSWRAEQDVEEGGHSLVWARWCWCNCTKGCCGDYFVNRICGVCMCECMCLHVSVCFLQVIILLYSSSRMTRDYWILY